MMHPVERTKLVIVILRGVCYYISVDAVGLHELERSSS